MEHNEKTTSSVHLLENVRIDLRAVTLASSASSLLATTIVDNDAVGKNAMLFTQHLVLLTSFDVSWRAREWKPDASNNMTVEQEMRTFASGDTDTKVAPSKRGIAKMLLSGLSTVQLQRAERLFTREEKGRSFSANPVEGSQTSLRRNWQLARITMATLWTDRFGFALRELPHSWDHDPQLTEWSPKAAEIFHQIPELIRRELVTREVRDVR